MDRGRAWYEREDVRTPRRRHSYDRTSIDNSDVESTSILQEICGDGMPPFMDALAEERPPPLTTKPKPIGKAAPPHASGPCSSRVAVGSETEAEGLRTHTLRGFARMHISSPISRPVTPHTSGEDLIASRPRPRKGIGRTCDVAD